MWFGSQLVSLIGTWMQNIAQGYLLYSLTGSVAYLGYVGFLWGLPSWLLMIYSGLIADRIPRRMLLILTQSIKMTLAFLLGVLVFLKWVQPWHILVLASLQGIANAFETPARKSLVIDLVPREDLTNAITLSDTMYSASVVVGPALGAAAYSRIGPSWCFFLNGVSFIAVIAALVRMQTRPRAASSQRSSWFVAIMEGFHYLRSSHLVQTLTIGEFLLSIIGYGPLVLLPAWSVKILNGHIATNALLLSVHGIGAVLGGVFFAVVASSRNRGKVWTSGSVILPLAMFVFAGSRNLPLSLFCLGLMGFSYVTVDTGNSAIIQSTVPDELRGRVIGTFALMYTGGEPLGALAAGLLADRTSESFTFYAGSVGLLLFAIIIWLFRPEVRRAD